MKKQDFNNHVRYYPPHHFVFLPIVTILFIVSIILIFKYPDHKMEWLAIALLFFFLLYLGIMVRQHYALGNQNRIVRLEMRLRYFQLTNQPFDSIESKLTFDKIAALRFAPNAELLLLIEKTLTENLSPKAIKQSIINWQPDYMRV